MAWLDENQIFEWAKEFQFKNKKFPTRASGKIPGTTEDWNTIDAALRYGYRGLEGGSSLSMLLNGRRAENRKRASEVTLTFDYIWVQARKFYIEHRTWPSTQGWCDNGISWANINQAIRQGTHGLGFTGKTLKEFISEKLVKILESERNAAHEEANDSGSVS